MSKWVLRMRHARRMAELGHADAAAKAKERYDRGHKEHPFEAGDRVAVWFPKGGKLDAPTLGPYIVSGFLDRQRRTARVYPEGREERQLTVHVDRLSPMPANEPAEWAARRSEVERWSRLVGDPLLEERHDELEAGPIADVPSEDVAEAAEIPDEIFDPDDGDEERDDREWEVEGIQGWAEGPDGQRRYLVRYKGCGPEKDRYYDEEDLRRTMPRELEEYERAVDEEPLAAQVRRIRSQARRSRRVQGLDPT